MGSISKINEYCAYNGVINYSITYEQSYIPKHNHALVFGMKYCYYSIRYAFLNRNAINRIEAIVKKNSIDIVHTNSSVVDIGAEIAYRCSLPHIWHLREFGKEDFNLIQLPVNTKKRLFRENNTFIAISKAVKEVWVKKGINSESIHVLYDGVEMPKTHNIPNVHNEKMKIVMVGALRESKGQHLLVEAIMMLPDEYKNNLLVDFYGSNTGEYYNKLSNSIYKFGLEHIVSFRGYIDNIYDVLTDYDVGINCSQSEGFGRVTVEYMACGLCPVVSASGANMEIVYENECGLTFCNGSSRDLSDKIKFLLDNPDEVKRYSAKSKACAANLYDIDINSNSIIYLFNKSAQKYKL